MADTPFQYSNLSGRPSSRLVRTLSRLVRGVREVQDQVVPYAGQWRAANLAALAADGPLWVALGDSMTQGIGASAYDRGWIGQLLATSDAVPSRLVNLSSSGAKVTDVLDRQLPAMRSLGVGPALVTVLIGSNDLIRARNRMDFPNLFGRMLDELPAGTVVASLPNPSRAAAAANDRLEQAAGRRGLVVAELRHRNTGSWKGKLAADHFHPNDLGYAGIAAVFAAAVAGRLAA